MRYCSGGRIFQDFVPMYHVTYIGAIQYGSLRFVTIQARFIFQAVEWIPEPHSTEHGYKFLERPYRENHSPDRTYTMVFSVPPQKPTPTQDFRATTFLVTKVAGRTIFPRATAFLVTKVTGKIIFPNSISLRMTPR